jgi:hypothetical protein
MRSVPLRIFAAVGRNGVEHLLNIIAGKSSTSSRHFPWRVWALGEAFGITPGQYASA